MKRALLILSVLMLSVTLMACGGSSEPTADPHHHGDDHHHDDGHGGHGDDTRVPNEGRVVRIVSPADGATFAAGQEVEIRVEFDNFELADGSHWHYYIDDDTGGKMMMDGMDDRIRDLEPGEHMISVYIAGGDHIEFEDGDKVMITVEE